jgi:hypothetical protein
MDATKVEPQGVNAHEPGGALPVVGTALALAKSTAGVEPAGEAETATAARSEALIPWAQGVARREADVLQREGKHEHEPPPEALLQKGEHNPKALSRKRELERCPDKGEREPVWLPGEAPRADKGAVDMPPREPPHEAVLSTWEGRGPWDPGGRPLRKYIAKSKGPVEAVDIAPGIDAHSTNDRRQRRPPAKKPGHMQKSVKWHRQHEQPRTLGRIPIFPIHRPGLLSSRSLFVFI